MPTLTFRDVEKNDTALLYTSLWSNRDYACVEELIERALVLRYHQRGGGKVVYYQNPADVDTPPLVCGFGLLTVWSRTGEISDLIVREDLRSLGIGTTLIQELIAYAQTFPLLEYIEIGAEINNPRALTLYERLGFVRYKTLHLEFQKGLSPVIYLRQKLDTFLSISPIETPSSF
jgi:ribosomal protein S18 acetylase RimI-like enzyme